MKEATARIKINKLLEAAGWRFFQDGDAPANIRLEPSVTIKSADLDALGENFEKTAMGFIDLLLLETSSGRIREIVDRRHFTDLANNPLFPPVTSGPYLRNTASSSRSASRTTSP